jgi:hypothetical protein
VSKTAVLDSTEAAPLGNHEHRREEYSQGGGRSSRTYRCRRSFIGSGGTAGTWNLRLALRLPNRTSIATGNILGSWFNEPALCAGESHTIPSTSASFNHSQRGQRVINYPSAESITGEYIGRLRGGLPAPLHQAGMVTTFFGCAAFGRPRPRRLLSYGKLSIKKILAGQTIDVILHRNTFVGPPYS